MQFEEKHIPSGTMSYPPINAEDFASQPHVSVYVCPDLECQQAAAEYIHSQIGHHGEYREFEVRP
jgi:hypothetical protein